MKSIEEIRICDRHEKEIPIIFTFAFNGSEYWCPYCGASWGMFGAGQLTDSTPKLAEELEQWTKKSEEFLSAKSTQVCSSLKWGGQRISPNELPDKEKIRLKKVIEDWEYEHDKEEA